MLVQMYMTSNSGKHPLPQNISSVSWLHLYLAVLCSVACEDDCFEAPFSCWDPLPHLQYCRSAVRSRLMSGRKSLNPLYSCLSTLPVIFVPYFHMGSAWQSQIHTLLPPTTELVPEWQGLAARGLWGECVGSGINQMFGLHLTLSIVSDNTIYILIDVPVGFGWAQLCCHPYPGKHFKVPNVMNGAKHHKCSGYADI